MADFLRRTSSFVKRHTVGRYEQPTPASSTTSSNSSSSSTPVSLGGSENQRKKARDYSKRTTATSPLVLAEAPETEAEEKELLQQQQQQQQQQQEKEKEEQQEEEQQEKEEQQEEEQQEKEEQQEDQQLPDEDAVSSSADSMPPVQAEADHRLAGSALCNTSSNEEGAASTGTAGDHTQPSPGADEFASDLDATILAEGQSRAHSRAPPSPHMRATSATERLEGSRPLRAASVAGRHGCMSYMPGARRASHLKHKRSISDVVSGSFLSGANSPTALSDSDASDSGDESVTPCKEGTMAKWTNYIHGWQDRYVVLQKGVLSYFKSAADKQKFCRGTVDAFQARIKPHPYDQLRFDVILKDHAYYLRAVSTEERSEWVRALQETQRMRAKGLTRRPSSMSLASISSGTSGQSYSRSVTDKYMESKALHDAFVGQLEQLQQTVAHLEGDDASEVQRDAVLVKSTSSGLLRAMSEWMDVMTRREDEWQRRYERLSEKKRRLEQEVRSARALSPQQFPNNPDFEEGPHSTLNDEEFYDALEIGLDQLEADEEETRRERELEAQRTARKPDPGVVVQHKFSPMLEKKLQENLKLAVEPVEQMWLLTHEEGQMTVYTRNEEAAGEPTDQLKAFHFIPGLTGKEVCSYFFDTNLRLEWEHTVEKFFVLQWLDATTNVSHNVHKRVWPTAQRDSCILSHMRQLDQDKWIVQNTSVEHDDAPANKYVRLTANVLLMAETRAPAGVDRSTLTRDDIGASLTYLAYVHPGGWAPVSVVKQVSKREYPKFLSNLETHSVKHYSDKPITW